MSGLGINILSLISNSYFQNSFFPTKYAIGFPLDLWKINSQTLKLPSGKILKGDNRKIFETKKIKLDVLKSEKIIGLN